jgi:hypothetical protein
MPLAYPLLATPPQMAFLASHHIHLKYASSFYDITQMDWYYIVLMVGCFRPKGFGNHNHGVRLRPVFELLSQLCVQCFGGVLIKSSSELHFNHEDIRHVQFGY